MALILTPQGKPILTTAAMPAKSYSGPVLSLVCTARFDQHALEYYWVNPRTGTQSESIFIGVDEFQDSHDVQAMILDRAVAKIGQVAILEAVFKEME
jgi:hypothetical protein